MVCDRSQKEKTERQLCGDTGNKVHVSSKVHILQEGHEN